MTAPVDHSLVHHEFINAGRVRLEVLRTEPMDGAAVIAAAHPASAFNGGTANLLSSVAGANAAQAASPSKSSFRVSSQHPTPTELRSVRSSVPLPAGRAQRAGGA